ncbi:MAG TPA: PAS domain S-box protein [Candidatus Sulfomarinibacteraceae bacterium]|nr:PAS domain S-box protein [Candidatus Sulfomarinibacteraceae bacterium]
MTVQADYFQQQYATALREFLRSGDEQALQTAYELGRSATQSELPLLDLATIYHEALRSMLVREASPGEEVALLTAAGTFFLESLTSLEMTLRRLQETNRSLRVLNDRLQKANETLEERVQQRTSRLSQSVQLLQKEIARRHRAQQALRESEARYRRLVERSPAPTAVFTQDAILFVNTAATHLLGAREPEELVGKPVTSILAEGRRQGMLQGIDAMLAEGNEYAPVEVQLVRLDGEIIDVEIVATHIAYEGRTAIQLVGYDVTERRQAEAAEREQRALAEALAASAASLNRTLDFDEVLQRALIHIDNVLPHDGANIMLIEGDVARVVHCRGYDERIDRGRIVGLELPMNHVGPLRHMWERGEAIVISDTRHNDQWLTMEPTAWVRSYVAAPIRLEGETIGFLSADGARPNQFAAKHAERLTAFADQVSLAMQNARLYEQLSNYSASLEQAVSERTEELQAANKRLETILQSVGDALLVVDQQGRVEQVNPAFEQQTGYGSDAVRERRLSDFLPGLEIPWQTLRENTSAGEKPGLWHGEFQLERSDGTLYDAAVTVAPLYDGDGDHTGFVAALMDVSLLKEVARSKDAFAANVSHELRTPITSLKLNHSLASHSEEGENPYLERLGRDIDRLNSLIEDLLRLSRLEQGQVELELDAVDLGALARRYVEDRQALAESLGLQLEFRQEGTFPTINADPGLLEQVVSIFLTNAMNYTPAGGEVLVTVESRRSEGRDWVGVRVSDTGPGLTDDDQAHLFERFYRGKTGLASGVPGTGLGLNIAREIVTRHDGHIEVQSEGVPGKGAAFTAWFPAPA